MFILFLQVHCNYSLLIYLPSCLGQETVKWPLLSSSEADTCYYQFNYLKKEAGNPVKCLIQGHNKQWLIFTLYLLHIYTL